MESTQDKSDTITVKQLVNFLNKKQRDPRLNEIIFPFYDELRAKEIINTYDRNPELAQQGLWSQDGLIRYLMSEENAPVFLDRLDIYMEMDQPLAHYYINSSHNTYLTGQQLGEKSSVEMYRQVLLAGCSKKQQYKLAKNCDDILGDLLLREPLTGYPIEPSVPLPSPNDLKRKIIIKNKRLGPEVEKLELELWRKGQLQNDDDNEDAAPDLLLITDEIIQDGEKKVSYNSGSLYNGGSSCRSSTKSPDVKEAPQLDEQIAIANYKYTGATVHVHPYLVNRQLRTTGQVPRLRRCRREKFTFQHVFLC